MMREGGSSNNYVCLCQATLAPIEKESFWMKLTGTAWPASASKAEEAFSSFIRSIIEVIRDNKISITKACWMSAISNVARTGNGRCSALKPLLEHLRTAVPVVLEGGGLHSLMVLLSPKGDKQEEEIVKPTPMFFHWKDGGHVLPRTLLGAIATGQASAVEVLMDALMQDCFEAVQAPHEQILVVTSFFHSLISTCISFAAMQQENTVFRAIIKWLRAHVEAEFARCNTHRSFPGDFSYENAERTILCYLDSALAKVCVLDKSDDGKATWLVLEAAPPSCPFLTLDYLTCLLRVNNLQAKSFHVIMSSRRIDPMLTREQFGKLVRASMCHPHAHPMLSVLALWRERASAECDREISRILESARGGGEDCLAARGLPPSRCRTIRTLLETFLEERRGIPKTRPSRKRRLAATF